MGEARRLVSPARVFARPTSDEIWLEAAQQAALSQLSSRRAQVRILVGPPSSGKTTLLQHLSAHLYPNAVVQHCRGPKADVSAVLAKDGAITLSVGGKTVATGKSPGLVLQNPAEGLTVGRDPAGAVGRYQAPNRFAGTIRAAKLELE